MSTHEITLHIPVDRKETAQWIQTQSPSMVADALSICECAINSMIKTTGDEKVQNIHLLFEKRTLDLKKELQAVKSKKDEENKEYEEKLGNTEAEIKKTYSKKIQNLEDELRAHSKEEDTIRRKVIHEYDEIRNRDMNVHAQEIRRMNDSFGREISQLHERLQDGRSQLVEREAAMQSNEETNKKLLADCTKRLENILCKRNNVVKGQEGEASVHEIFSRLNLGLLHDDSHNKSQGYADATWEYDTPSCQTSLRCMVEVKNVMAIHSKKDVAKFDTDLQVAVASGRCNAAMFVSLQARIPGKEKIDITSMHGVPVLWISRLALDEMSVSTCVELAFMFFAQCWPLLCEGRGDDDISTTTSSMCDHLERQRGEYNKLTKIITRIESASRELYDEAKTLKDVRNKLIEGIDKLQIKNPQLVPVFEYNRSVENLQKSISNWHLDKCRYPVTVSDLQLEDTELERFALHDTNFIDAITYVKQNNSKKRKIKSMSGEDKDEMNNSSEHVVKKAAKKNSKTKEK